MNQLKYHPKILLVEGKEDQRVIPELMEKNGINWGSRQNPIVYIVDSGGYEKLIEQDIIATELQRSGLEALGIIIDADDHPQHRWQSLRNACLKSIPDLPEELPNLGLINITPNQIKLGIWMMPDNQMRGMLETFLAYLIPAEGNLLWEFAQEVA